VGYPADGGVLVLERGQWFDDEREFPVGMEGLHNALTLASFGRRVAAE